MHPPLAFLRNYVLRGGFRQGTAGLIVSLLNSYYVLLKFVKLWELEHAQPEPAAAREPSNVGRAPPERAVFSLHIDTAATWRGGQNQVLLTVLGLRERGERAMLVAHPDGELRQRAEEGLELVPLAPGHELDLKAAWKLARVIRRVRPDIVHAHDPHGVAMASMALSMLHDDAVAAPGGGPTRRLPSQAQFVLEVEIPAGRSLHRRRPTPSGAS